MVYVEKISHRQMELEQTLEVDRIHLLIFTHRGMQHAL